MEYGFDTSIGKAKMQAAQEVADGRLNNHYSLVTWQTCTGKQSNKDSTFIHTLVSLCG